MLNCSPLFAAMRSFVKLQKHRNTTCINSMQEIMQ